MKYDPGMFLTGLVSFVYVWPFFHFPEYVCTQSSGLSDKSRSMSRMALEVFCSASEMQFSVSLISGWSEERSQLKDLPVGRRTGLFSNKTGGLC